MDNDNKLIDSMNVYYERRAPWHDEYMSFSGNAAMETLLRPLVDLISPIIQDRSVIEIACGTGNWTEVLAKRARRVLATDFSPAALDLARAKLAGYHNIEYRHIDAYDLKPCTSLFDAAVAADWYSHMPLGSISKFLSCLGKLLKPGASVVFFDMSNKETFEPEFVEFDRSGNRIYRRTLPDSSRHDVIKNFPTEGELREQLKPFGQEIGYFEFAELQRWLVTYRSK